MSFRISSTTLLDPKTCYELWAKKRISIYKIPELLAKQGVVNPSSGKNVTPQGVWRAACLYMLEYPEIAKSDTVSIFSQRGQVWDDGVEREFRAELVAKAQQHLSKTKYKQFLLSHPEFNPHG